MTTQTILVEPARRADPYPDPPKRDDMQNVIYLDWQATVPALRERFGNRDTTLIGEIRLGPSLSVPKDTRVPDLLVAFNCDVAQAREDNGYSLESQPHPPQFVLEVASKTTGIVDYTAKRSDYARYGVAEYWRFDPTGGAYHDRSLAGDRLVDGRYERIAIQWRDDEHGRGYSAALGLYVCWEREELRFYDPVAERYVRTLADEAAERRAEAAGRRREAARADMEAELRRREAERRRQADERRRQAEAQAEAEAEARRQEAEARRQAEAREAAAETRAAELQARLAELTRQRQEDNGA